MVAAFEALLCDLWCKKKKITSVTEESELKKLQALHHYVSLELNVYNIKRGKKRGRERRRQKKTAENGVDLIKVPLCTYLKMLPTNRTGQHMPMILEFERQSKED